MKKLFVVALSLALVQSARATSITGSIAIAGADIYTSAGIKFTTPSIVLIASGSLVTLTGHVFTLKDLAFSSTPSIDLFTTSGVDMHIDTLHVQSINNNFLNIIGTATMMQVGFTNTAYDYTLTATRPDGVSSYTLTATPEAVVGPVAEVGTLVLTGTGLMVFGLIGFIRGRFRSPDPEGEKGGYPIGLKIQRV